jgi:uncharacterized protein DUF3501
MKRIERADLLDNAAYEAARNVRRQRIIDLKRARRVRLGEHMSLVFENRDTVLFQIQEMLRAEQITNEAGIAHELETYNELIPDELGLSGTLFVEYEDAAERDRMLVLLAGVEDKFALSVDGERVPANNATRGTRSDRTTAVHYMKFPLGERLASLVRSLRAPIALSVAHPNYSASTPLPVATLKELAADLA